MPFNIVRQDITKMQVDVIVNAANTELQMGGGVCGAIFKAAGIDKMTAACSKAAPIKTGEAVMTPGFELPCKYVIHAAGPVYHYQDAENCEKQLRSAYTESLRLAALKKCESIAFPLISSGIYGYPKEEALRVASSAIQDFLSDWDMEVYLAVFDKESFTVSEKLLGEVAEYIDENYADEHIYKRRRLLEVERSAFLLGMSRDLKAEPCERAVPLAHKEEMPVMAKSAAPQADVSQDAIGDIIGNLDEPFSQTLIRLIDKKARTDVEVYKRANISRKLFSKIRTGKGYLPGKRTIIALAVALELNLEEAGDLLQCAGYAFSHSQKFDVIVEYFILNKRYNIFEINEVLFKYDQQLLGG